MIKFETHVGKPLGTAKLTDDGDLICSSEAVEDIVTSKRVAHGWDNQKIYAWLASGALDNGYVRATEVAA